MKKALSLVFALLMLTALLAGCGSSASSSTPAPQPGTGSSAPSGDGSEGNTELSGKVTIWGWTPETEVLDNFRAAYPNVEVEMVIVDSGDYMTKVQSTLASGGELPDILWGEILLRGKLYDMDILDDLTQPPYNFDTSIVEPYLLPSMTNEAGQVLGIEWSQNPAGLGYRRDLASQYLGTEDKDELQAMLGDWDAFIEKGQEVLAASDGKVYMLPSLGDAYYMVNGQSATPRIANGEINEAEALRLFTEITKLRDAGIVSKIEQWTPAWFASFATDEAIFHPVASWGIVNHIKENDATGEGNWGLMVPPEGGFSWGGTSWSITKTSQNKELAWELINFINFSDSGVQLKKDMGYIPSVAGVENDPSYSEREDSYFGDIKPTEVFVKDVVPTIHINQITPYDMLDIMTMELVLSTMNADYSVTAEQATAIYLDEMLNGAPELVVK